MLSFIFFPATQIGFHGTKKKKQNHLRRHAGFDNWRSFEQKKIVVFHKNKTYFSPFKEPILKIGLKKARVTFYISGGMI
jgi:hypothetical protein